MASVAMLLRRVRRAALTSLLVIAALLLSPFIGLSVLPAALAQSSALTLTSAPALPTYSVVEQRITITYSVTNASGAALSGPISLADSRAGTFTCLSGNLAAGATATCSTIYTISQADLDDGSITTHATASAQSGGGLISSNEVTTNLTTALTGQLTMSRSASPEFIVDLVTPISYSYTLVNHTNVTLSQLTIIDDKAPNVSCNATQLAPQASTTCAGSHTVTQADLDAGSVVSTATASASGGSDSISVTQTLTVLAESNPIMVLLSTSSSEFYSAAGQTIQLSYTLTNVGNVALSGPFSVSDENDAITISCPSISSLAPDRSLTCHGSYQVTQADMDVGVVVSNAVAHAFFGSTQQDSNLSEIELRADWRPALALTVTASPGTYSAVDQQISYSYRVVNNGNVTLTTSDAQPGILIGPLTVSDDRLGTVACTTPATIAPGGSFSCTSKSYTITAADLAAGSIVSTVTVQTDELSATTTFTLSAQVAPALTLSASVSPTSYRAAGETLAFSFVATNSGNVTLSESITVSASGLTVSCPANPGLAPAASLTCTASHTVSAADLTAGSLSRSATARTSHNSATVTSNTASATATLAGSAPALSLTRAATPISYSAVGDVISFEYLVTYTGSTPLLSRIRVSDNKLTVSCPALPAGGLAPGASQTCTGSYTVKQADLNNGGITSNATARAGTLSSATVTLIIPIAATVNRSLGLTMSATPTVYRASGQAIALKYVLKNTGSAALTGPFAVSGAGTTACPARARLAPGASMSCTGSYTISAADMANGSATLTAVAQGMFNSAVVSSAPASVNMTKASASAQLTRGNVGCAAFKNGTAADLSELLYTVRSGQIRAVSPNNLNFYSPIIAPSASFTIQVLQTNGGSLKALNAPKGQVTLFNASCNNSGKRGTVTVTVSGTTQTVTIPVSGATPGETLFLLVNYDSTSVASTKVTAPYPQATYAFETFVGSSSVGADSLLLRPK